MIQDAEAVFAVVDPAVPFHPGQLPGKGGAVGVQIGGHAVAIEGDGKFFAGEPFPIG